MGFFNRTPKSTEPSPQDYQTVPVADLTPGLQLLTPIYDSKKVLLLAAKKSITTALINGLMRRGVESVQIHKSELHRIYQTEAAPPVEAPKPRRATPIVTPIYRIEPEAHKPRVSGLPPLKPNERPFSESVRSPGMISYSSSHAVSMLSQYQQSLEDLHLIYETWISGQMADLERPREIAAETLDQLKADRDLLVRVGLQSSTGDFPVRQSLQTAWIALAIGTTLNLPQAMLIDLGTGCLLHDIGLLGLRPNIQQQLRETGEISDSELTKHPRYAYDILNRNERVSQVVKLIAFQIHERNDGTGYPCGRRAHQIHPLARIAAVAHAFVEVTAPYARSSGLSFYEAQRLVLEETHLGRFDPDVTRGLLQTASLTPIGSTVQLADGRPARVLRANPDDYSRPIVQLLDQTSETESLLDLSQNPGVQIARVISLQESTRMAQTVGA